MAATGTPYHLLGDWAWDHATLPALGLVLAIHLITKRADAGAAHRQRVLPVEQVGRFVDQCCVIGSDEECAATGLYRRYRDRADEEGILHRLSRNDFVKRMECENAGVIPCGKAHAHGLKGIGPTSQAGPRANAGLHRLRQRLRRQGEPRRRTAPGLVADWPVPDLGRQTERVMPPSTRRFWPVI